MLVFCPLEGGFLVENRRVQKACVCLFVCLCAKTVRFAEWYLHRGQTQIPLGVLRGASKEGPKSLSFNPPVELISGTRKFEHFFDFLNKNIGMLCWTPERDLDAFSLRKSHLPTHRQPPSRGRHAPRVQTSNSDW